MSTHDVVESKLKHMFDFTLPTYVKNPAKAILAYFAAARKGEEAVSMAIFA